MLDRLLDWLLPLVVLAAALFLLYLVREQLKEEAPPSVPADRQSLELSGVPSQHAPHLTGGSYHYYPRLCGPAPAVVKSRSIYSWRDEAGTLNLSDQPPAAAEFRETVIALDWAEGSFKLNLSVHHSAVGKLPLSFESRLRSGAYAIIRSLAQVSGQRQLVPVHVALSVYGTKADYHGGTSHRKEGSLGMYSQLSGNAAMYVQGSEKATLRVAQHEITHALNCNMFGVLPPWLNEGLANYFEAMDVQGAVGRVRAAPRILQVAKAHARYGEQNVVAMLDSDDEAFWNARDNTYPLSASLIFSLLDSGSGRAALGRYLGTLADRQGRARFTMPSSDAFMATLDHMYPGGRRRAWGNWQAWVSTRRSAEHTWRW